MDSNHKDNKMNEWMKPRTIFAFMFYFSFLYLIMRGIQVPEALNTIISTLFGYWYGNKNSIKGGLNDK